MIIVQFAIHRQHCCRSAVIWNRFSILCGHFERLFSSGLYNVRHCLFRSAYL